ncbi:Regulator of chromosome condensation (RCC1) repeat protein [compost metagenome]
MAVAGEGTFLFTRGDGTVWGFGKNGDGLLGTGTEAVMDPVKIEGLDGIAALEAGNHHVMALDGQGRVYTWGRNMDGQLGRVPVILDRWQDMGELPGVRKAVAAPGRPYFIMEDGTLRAMQPDRSVGAVQGVADLRELRFVLGYPVTLDAAGTVRLWEKDFAASKPLALSYQVKEMAAGGDRLLLLDSSGNLNLVYLEQAAGADGQLSAAGSAPTSGLVPAGAERATAEGGWTGRVRSLHGNPYMFMALTEDGKVFYADRSKEGSMLFRSVLGLNPVKELSLDDYVLHTAEPQQVWALEENGDLREIRLDMKMEWKNSSGKLEILSASAQVQPAIAKQIARISGSLRVHADGTADEDRYKIRLQAALPAPVRLVSSFYDYNIEGPGQHYHVLVDERNRISLLGYNPFGQGDAVPGIVPFP